MEISSERLRDFGGWLPAIGGVYAMIATLKANKQFKAYLASPGLDARSLKAIPLVLAGWLRYLMGVDDQGRPFELSSDPLLPDVRPFVADIRLGDVPSQDALENRLRPLLSNASIFGVDLFKAQLAQQVCRDFAGLISGPGAVRKALQAL